ncbi:hypothetical protein [Marinobacter halophilus]|uniref:hypothetical protein n=1 Tax=Marinobacter halophilus TaxID=1323740 RepID=UPI0016672E1F|nr:hypothetical protein [Marinobacter halophilus]GGC65072.1 hypothetical protein GCM10011362_11720 [Marinobacter halophilus]
MNGPDNNVHWWLGVAELLAHGMQHGAVKLKRVHLAIADESFRVLETIPVTRQGSRMVRTCHHSVSHVTYASVEFAGRAVAEVAGRASYRSSGKSERQSEPPASA